MVLTDDGVRSNAIETCFVEGQRGEGGANGAAHHETQGTGAEFLLGHDDPVVAALEIAVAAKRTAVAGSLGAVLGPAEHIRRTCQPRLTKLVVGGEPVETSATFTIASPAHVVVVERRVGPQQELAARRPALLKCR